jgi:hypothetical protein
MKMEIIKTLENGNKKLVISREEYPESPRDDRDNFGIMCCFHRRYNLGDKHNLKADDFNSMEEIKEYLIKEEKAEIILALNLYDHSGITISINSSYPYNDRWDSGIVGFIYVTKERILEEFGKKKLTKELIKKAENILKAEVELYDKYLQGDIYEYRIYELIICDKCKHIEEKHIDSCCGFYGDDINTNGMKDNIEDFENYKEREDDD